MEQRKRIEAARGVSKRLFPGARTIMLTGSTARNEQKAHSDIDLLIIVDEKLPYNRKCLAEGDYLYELFIYDEASFFIYLNSECMIGNPSLARMCAESIIIAGSEKANELKEYSSAMLREGLPELTKAQLDYMRYTITDLLVDLEDCQSPYEQLFIGNALLKAVTEFLLKANGQWIGEGKWLARSLLQYKEQVANECWSSFQDFFETGNKRGIIEYVDRTLALFGGRVFDGFEQ